MKLFKTNNIKTVKDRQEFSFGFQLPSIQLSKRVGLQKFEVKT